MVDKKACSKCGLVKPASEFYKAADRPSGLGSRCKECSRAEARIWRRKNAARNNERQKRHIYKRNAGLVPVEAMEDYRLALRSSELEVERLRDQVSRLKVELARCKG